MSGDTVDRRRIGIEVGIVLALSLGASAVYSVVAIIDRLTRPENLGDQSATINRPLDDRAIFDLIYQLLAIAFGLAAVALVLYLLWRPGLSPFQRIGLDFTRFGRDLLGGLGLAAVIGIPGLAFYALGRALGITVDVVPTALDTYWWTVPVLVLAALRAALTEEVIVIGYLYNRLGMLGWGKWTIILSTAALRGSYHLYQGFGPFVGNFAMGVLFGWAYLRWGRVMPLVIAHFLLDMVSFVGYAWAVGTFPDLFG
jgi:membrane protease YdiL (CAAX protease family)